MNKCPVLHWWWSQFLILDDWRLVHGVEVHWWNNQPTQGFHALLIQIVKARSRVDFASGNEAIGPPWCCSRTKLL